MFKYTPQIISDILYELKFKNLRLIYYNKKLRKYISYNFNHGDYDGELMAHSIKNNLVKFSEEKNVSVYNFEKYQYLKNNRIKNFSLFTSSIAQLLYKMMIIQKRTLNIIIIVSVRNKSNDFAKKGNFIKFAKYSVNPNNSVIEICNIHHNNVQDVKNNDDGPLNTTLHP